MKEFIIKGPMYVWQRICPIQEGKHLMYNETLIEASPYAEGAPSRG